MTGFEIEEEFLSLLMMDPNLFKKLVISDEVFLDLKNKFIFNLLKKQFEDIKTIDIPTLYEKYKNYFSKKYPAKDIIEKITLILGNSFSTTSKFNYYQETLHSRFIKNEMMNVIKEYQLGKIETEELLDTIHRYENQTIKIDENRLSPSEIFQIINSQNKNINFRFEVLSKYANIQEHDTVVVAARPGVGKTGFILNLLEDLSDTYNCILFNMEMSEKQVYSRLVSINTQTDLNYLTNPVTDYQKNAIQEGCKNISNKKIKVYSSSQTILTIKRIIVNESKKEHTIVFIDYVGLINSIDKKQNSYERVTAIVKELRQISIDYNCTIFIVSQLNRNAGVSDDRIPKLIDLKETGELEQSGTTVLMLYDENHDLNISKEKIDISVIIAKNRNGKNGIVPLRYNKLNQRFDIPEKKIKNPNEWRKENGPN